VSATGRRPAPGLFFASRLGFRGRGSAASIEHGEPPWVLFICQDEQHRDKFLAAADRDLTGHLWHPSAGPSEQHYPGRRRILFACEADAHAGIPEARRVPAYPPAHPSRRGKLAETRRVRLPRPDHRESTAAGIPKDAPEHGLAGTGSRHLSHDPELVITSRATEIAQRLEFLGGRPAETQPTIASEEYRCLVSTPPELRRPT
jgi:hypothetical protein